MTFCDTFRKTFKKKERRPTRVNGGQQKKFYRHVSYNFFNEECGITRLEVDGSECSTMLGRSRARFDGVEGAARLERLATAAASAVKWLRGESGTLEELARRDET